MPRIRPRVWIGFAVVVGYVVLVYAIQLSSGIPYTEWGDNGHNLFFGGGISLIVGAIALAITTTALGWWRRALFEESPSGFRGLLALPILLVLVVVANLAFTDWSAYDAAFLGASLVLLLVGFTEELTVRGLLLTALRSRLREGWVWFLTSLIFGSLHFGNIVLGQGVVATAGQAGLAFLFGTVLYITRRVTGSLIPAMVLHALWDFSIFAVGHGQTPPFAGLGVLVELPVGLVAVGLVVLVARRPREMTPV